MPTHEPTMYHVQKVIRENAARLDRADVQLTPETRWD